ncbi:MAG: hypothetical protein GF411_19255 [Candidatus Lokiarchaeota archaeon]|nr:hypothetical protein [Candidatus Lokiarchaeota archaeon]
MSEETILTKIGIILERIGTLRILTVFATLVLGIGGFIAQDFWTLTSPPNEVTSELFYLPQIVSVYLLAIIGTTVFTIIGYIGKIIAKGDLMTIIFMVLFFLPAFYATQSLGILFSPEAMSLEIDFELFETITSSVYSATGTLYLAFTILGLGRASNKKTRVPGLLTTIFSFIAMIQMGYTFMHNPNAAFVHISLLTAVPAFIGLFLIEKRFLFEEQD